MKSVRHSINFPKAMYARIMAYAGANDFSFSQVVIHTLVPQFGAPIRQGDDVSASPEDPLVELANQRFPKSPTPAELAGLPNNVINARVTAHQRELDAIMDARRETGINPVGGKGEAARYRLMLPKGKSRLVDD